MRQHLLLGAGIAALGFFTCCASVGAEGEDALPDVNVMTVEQLLEEFHRPPYPMHPPAPQRRIDVINALRKLGEPLLSKLKEDLKNPDAEVKIAAGKVLTNLGQAARPAVPELVAALGDENESVRVWAISAVGHLKAPRAFHALVAASRDPSPRIRARVLRSAHECFSDAEFAMAVLALSDEDQSVRRAAIWRLRTLRDRRAVPFLVPLLEDVETRSYSVSAEGNRIAMRNCDDVVLALELIVNNRPLGLFSGTQEERDLRVEQWRQWWEEQGEKFTQELYAEPELRKSRY